MSALFPQQHVVGCCVKQGAELNRPLIKSRMFFEKFYLAGS